MKPIIEPTDKYETIKSFRRWVRKYNTDKLAINFKETLAFRILPGEWPNIRICPPEGVPDDVSAKAFEIHMTPSWDKEKVIRLLLWDFTVVFDFSAKVISVGAERISFYPNKEIILCIEKDICLVFHGDHELTAFAENREKIFVGVDNSVSGNLDRCEIEQRVYPCLQIKAEGGVLNLGEITVYGLAEKTGPDYEKASKEVPDISKDKIFFQSEKFKVYDHRVCDANYGYPDALAVDGMTVVSPQRVIEEFEWRETPWGDMVRVTNRDEIWYGTAALRKYPDIHSGFATIDAAYHIATDIFYTCKKGDYSLNGQKGLWAAGQFQCKGEGFGVWLRDSVHIAMRSGTLVDPEGAKDTLLYAIKKGFDNGADGPALGAVGVWDYYLATGDIMLVREAWPVLQESMRQTEERFDKKMQLIRAEQSTSNDAFPEPENGGFSLGTECYFALAYKAMSKMGSLIGYADIEQIEDWNIKGEILKNSILEKYWNSSCQYYTSGPIGSEANINGYWESSGMEAILWDKFGLVKTNQKETALEAMKEVALCDYGIVVFPYRKDKNHFCGSVWGVWQAGFASALAETGQGDLVKRLIAQQVRVCMMNKTFYEVIDAETGYAWRWPGQLWHAAGFISLILYGVFGINYTEEGMYFHPCVPEELKDIRLERLNYRGCKLNIQVKGWGNHCREILVNGAYSDHISCDCSKNCDIILCME